MASQELQLGSVKGKNIKVSDKFPSGMEAKVLEKKTKDKVGHGKHQEVGVMTSGKREV